MFSSFSFCRNKCCSCLVVDKSSDLHFIVTFVEHTRVREIEWQQRETPKTIFRQSLNDFDWELNSQLEINLACKMPLKRYRLLVYCGNIFPFLERIAVMVASCDRTVARTEKSVNEFLLVIGRNVCLERGAVLKLRGISLLCIYCWLIW